MARVLRAGDATRLALPGRTSYEIVSGAGGARGVTLRRVEIPVATAGEPARARHCHRDFEECIYVLAGRGVTSCESGELDVAAGDTVLVPPGEMHATRNTGEEPLVLLCFFPVSDIRQGTQEPVASRAESP